MTETTEEVPRAWAPSARIVLGVVLTVGIALLAPVLLNGWFPHDEGALGQSAERVLAGEVPHRDFDEIYTGLLTYINAAAFATFGISSASVRMPLFVAAIAWLWAMYGIALRYAPPLGAGLVSVVAFIWGVRNYPAPVPSWYILFLATYMVLVLLIWHERGGKRWLILAGILAGIAFLFKLSGLSLLFGGGLALLARHSTASSATLTPRRRGTFEIVVPLVLLAMALVLALSVGSAGLASIFRHAVPSAALCLAIGCRIWLSPSGSQRERWRDLVNSLAPFAFGAILPIAAYCALFAMVGGLHALLEGVFLTPFRRLTFASSPPPPIVAVIFALPVAGLLWQSTKSRSGRMAPFVAALWFLIIIVFSGPNDRMHLASWLSFWGVLFIIASVGAWRIVAPASDLSDTMRHGVASTVCVAVALSLMEYPFATLLYVLYGLPLALLALTALVRTANPSGWPTQLIVVCFALVSGLFRLNSGMPSLRRNLVEAPLARSGLRIPADDAAEYGALIPLIRQRDPSGTIWAGPDAPEVYFLSGMKNKTRTLFDFLDAPSSQSFAQRMESLGVTQVVVNMKPDFSEPIDAAEIHALQRVFPNWARTVHFLVLWKDAPAGGVNR